MQLPTAPAMPITSISAAAAARTPQGDAVVAADHQDHIAPAGFISNEWYAMVHKPIPLQKARKIEKTSKAIDKEFAKLGSRGFVEWESVREKQHVIDDARSGGYKIHLGALMTLCHEKNAELFLPDDQK